jgi:IS30 family transposase
MAKPRPNIQKQLDRAAIAELSLKGWTQIQIAQFLEIDQSTVSRDLSAIEKSWQESAQEDRAIAKQRELKRLALVEKELWDSWDISKRGQETTVEEVVRAVADAKGEGSADDRNRVRRSTRSAAPGAGNPRILAEILRVIHTRMELLGMKNQDVNNGRTGPVEIPADLEAMSDVELSALTQKLLSKHL